MCLKKLKAEPVTAIPDPLKYLPLSALEQLPYLTTCIQEGLRLSCSVSSRLQRICPDEDLIFNDGKKQWSIPRGTLVGMTSTIVHYDPSTFPSLKSFRPERWMENPRLVKYLITFSKASRQCIGINLTYAEIFLAVATIFRQYSSKDVRSKGDLRTFE
jgi:cytochrome P450